MERREFIAALGSAAMAWPLVARAQQDTRVRRIGMLIPGVQNSRGSQINLAALREGLAKLGWIEGRNLQIDLRFAAGDANRVRAYAVELVSLAPDVIVTTSFPATAAMQQQTRTIPIVFTAAGDPVSNGLLQ